MRERLIIHIARWTILALILAIWQWGWDFRHIVLMPKLLDPYFISKPSLIWQRFLEMGCFVNPQTGEWLLSTPGAIGECLTSARGNLWLHTITTLRNTFWGFVIGVGSGVVAGLVLGRSRVLAQIFEPYIVAFNSLPRVALVPLIIVMFGLGDVSKVATAFTLVFFVVFFNTFEGARSVDRDYINAARLLGASNWQITRTVYIPSALAWVFASLTPAISFALIGVIVGEFIGAEHGLGKLIIEAEATLQIPDMMAALFVLMFVGIALVVVVRAIQARLLRWQPQSVDVL